MTTISIGFLAGVSALAIISGAGYLAIKLKNKKNLEEQKDYFLMTDKDVILDKKFHKNQIIDTSVLNNGNVLDFTSGTLITSSSQIKKKKIKADTYGEASDPKVILRPKQHTVLFGASGSGKSNTFLIPQIALNALCKDKPSGLVLDPKGELFAALKPRLEAAGKKAYLLNLAEPSQSNRLSMFQLITNYLKNYLRYAFICNFIVDKNVFKQAEEQKDIYYTRALSSMTDLAEVLVSASSKEASVWTANAKQLMTTTFTIFTDIKLTDIQTAWTKTSIYKKYQSLKEGIDKKDSETTIGYQSAINELKEDKEFNDLLTEQLKDYNYVSLNAWISNTPQVEFIKYLNSQNKSDLIQLFQTAPEQYNSFKMNLSGAFQPFLTDDIKSILSISDFDFDEFIEGDTYLFLKIPAADKTKQSIATLLVQQLWNYLEFIATSSKGNTLPHPFYFYLEELANAPKISCLETIITLGRSYKIFGFIVVQSLSQLESIYGKENFKSIYDSCMCKTYLRVEDEDTLNRISNMFGATNRKATTEDGHTIRENVLTVQDLKNNEIGNAYVWYEGSQPAHIPLKSWDDYLFMRKWEHNKFMSDWDFKQFKSTDYKNELLDRLKKLFKITTPKTPVAVAPNQILTYNQRFLKWWNLKVLDNVLKEWLLEDGRFYTEKSNGLIQSLKEDFETYFPNVYDTFCAFVCPVNDTPYGSRSSNANQSTDCLELINKELYTTNASPFVYLDAKPQEANKEQTDWKKDLQKKLISKEYYEDIKEIVIQLFKLEDIKVVKVEKDETGKTVKLEKDIDDNGSIPPEEYEPVNINNRSFDALQSSLTELNETEITKDNKKTILKQLAEDYFTLTQIVNIYSQLNAVHTKNKNEATFFGFGKLPDKHLVVKKEKLILDEQKDTKLFKQFSTQKKELLEKTINKYNAYLEIFEPNIEKIKKISELPHQLSAEEQKEIRKTVANEYLARVIKDYKPQ